MSKSEVIARATLSHSIVATHSSFLIKATLTSLFSILKSELRDEVRRELRADLQGEIKREVQLDSGVGGTRRR
jgi:hypothetical protein